MLQRVMGRAVAGVQRSAVAAAGAGSEARPLIARVNVCAPRQD